jgi:hypothetical protein
MHAGGERAALVDARRLVPRTDAGEAVRNGVAPAVVGRIEDRRLLLALRAVPATDDEPLTSAVIAAGRVAR